MASLGNQDDNWQWANGGPYWEDIKIGLTIAVVVVCFLGLFGMMAFLIATAPQN